MTALRMFDLSGRVAIVTGGSSGLGEAIARTLADAGAKVAVTARRVERLQPPGQENGGGAGACDLLDGADLDRLVPAVVSGLGAPQILVNVAGNIFSHERAEDEPA